jgi:dCTP deaminase
MVLSDKQIIEEKRNGNIVITPFHKENLSTSSYDVSLGEFFYRESNNHGRYNIYSESETNNVWHLHRAIKASELAGGVRENISKDEKIILIGPGETILAHTNEFIGGRNNITTMMKARSSMGRQLIAVCKCAGWGDVGYVNRWTLEITNYSQYHTIPLVVGRRIAQIVFMETGEILESDYAIDGKYQTSQDVKKIREKWKPEDMLPKLWKDRDIR